jgi:hypothetical protein
MSKPTQQVVIKKLKEKKKKCKVFTDRRSKDLRFGANKEKVILPIINQFFNFKLELQKDRYSVFDFKDDVNKIVVELKSRRLTKRKYPTTMISYNKVLKGFDYISKGYKVFIVFCFTNKLCYYQLSEDTFKKRWVSFNQTTRCDRGYSEVSDMCYVPVDELTNIQKVG